MTAEQTEPTPGTSTEEMTPAERRALDKLEKELIADPNSTMGNLSYAPGQSPEELATAAPTTLAEPGTELEQIERDNGFTFGTPNQTTETAGAPPSAALVCTNPECPNRNQHVQINTDTILPIRCGACSQVLLCDHDYQPMTRTEGTLNNPTRVDWTECTTCHDRTPEQRTELPSININDIPIAQAQALLGGTIPDAPA